MIQCACGERTSLAVYFSPSRPGHDIQVSSDGFKCLSLSAEPFHQPKSFYFCLYFSSVLFLIFIFKNIFKKCMCKSILPACI